MSANGPYTFGFIDSLVRINFPQRAGDYYVFWKCEGGDDLARAARSLDGKTWELSDTPVKGFRTSIFCAAFGQKIWMVVSYNGNQFFPPFTSLYISTDKAQTWSEISSLPLNIPASVAFGNGRFVVLAGDTSEDTTTVSVCITKDLGKTWAVADLPAGPALTAHSVVFVKDAFFVLTHNAASNNEGGLGDCFVLRSTDGVSWSTSAMFSAIPLLSQADPDTGLVAYARRTVCDLTYDPILKKFLAVGTVTVGTFPQLLDVFAADTSSDGLNWSGGISNQNYRTGQIATAASGSTGGKGVFVTSAIFIGGPPSDVAMPVVAHILSSLDGVNWTPFQPIPGSGSGSDASEDNSVGLIALYSGQAKLYVVMFTHGDGSTGFLFKVRVFTSSDGFAWTEQPFDLSGPVENILVGGAIGDLKTTS